MWWRSIAPHGGSLPKAKPGRCPGIGRVSPDGKLLLVSNRDDATVSLLGRDVAAPLGLIHVAPHPEQIAILPDGSKAFVTSGTTDQISVLDLKRRELVANLR